MQYVNPLEILDLTDLDLLEIDDDLIRKRKKIVLNEATLNNGFIILRNHEISKNTINDIVEELYDANKKRFHYFILQHYKLNQYLSEGIESLFEKYTISTLFSDVSFINFLSPYFSNKYEYSIHSAFIRNDSIVLSNILKYKILLTEDDFIQSISKLDRELINRIEKIVQIKLLVEEGNLDYCVNDFIKVVNFIKDNVKPEILNLLPKYFQSTIDKLSEEINYLQLELKKNYKVKLEILSILIQINSTSLHSNSFKENHQYVKDKFEDEIEKEQNAPILKKWITVLEILDGIKDDIISKEITPKKAIKTISDILNIEELNLLPKFGNEIRFQISYKVRLISIEIWNNTSDIDSSLEIIKIPLHIKNQEEDIKIFEKDVDEFNELKKKKELKGDPVKSAPNLETFYGIGTKIYFDTLYFVVLWVPIIPLARYNLTESYGTYTFYGKYKLYKHQKVWQLFVIFSIILLFLYGIYEKPINDFFSGNSSNPVETPVETPKPIDSTPVIVNTPPPQQIIETPKINIIQMSSGEMDCSNVHSKYNRDLPNRLEITAQSTDAVVKLINNKTGKCIRYVYVKDGETYTIKNIPEGVYRLKLGYGHDWGVTEGGPVCKGKFQSGRVYKIDDELYDFNIIEHDDGRRSLPSFTLKLFTQRVNRDELSGTNNISEDDFDNN